MAITTEEELTSIQRETVKKARRAAQLSNYEYVVTLIGQVLKEVPTFHDGRKFLRESVIKKLSAPSKMQKSLSTVTMAPQIFKAQSAAKKSPEESLLLIEGVLAVDPYNAQANQLLCQVAQEMNMMETACFALETLHKGDPQNTQVLHDLAKLYLKMKDPRARTAYEAILNIKPNDGEAISGLKNAEATGTLRQGGWEQAQSYRDIIKDKDEAVRLEQASKISKTEEAVDALIAEQYALHQADPQNSLPVKKLAELYRQKGDLENAIAWYQYAFDLSGKADSGIEQVLFDLQLKQFDGLIKQWEDYIAASPDNPEVSEHQRTLEGIRNQRRDVVLNEARARVQRYPNDLQFRFDLGEALFNANDIAGAIPELQQSMRQPAIRLRAMLLLSLCFRAKGQLDIAARRLEEAAGEVHGMDDTKKDLLYNLGLVREEMGQKDAAIEAFKQIYEVDYGYRDVAQRVEAS
jgi:tetratricopeptide (TPR) repeat protein